MKRLLTLSLAALLAAALTGCGARGAKPVIYLYPEEETQVTVQLDYAGELTCTYPAYNDGWTVIASPDGTLTDGEGQTYSYLYWEGKDNVEYDFSQGACVAGEDTAAFLEDALSQLGLTRREANERMLERARAVGRGFEVEGVLDDWMSMLRPRRRMQTLVAQLKQRGYCVYYLSNIPEDVLDLLMHRDFEGLFDGGVASCEVKINKPDPRIYQALLDKYHLRADECIFIDDRADNLVAASALGFGIYEMHGVGTLLRSLPTFGVSLH